MSIKIGNINIADVKIGETQISSIYAGTNLIWEYLKLIFAWKSLSDTNYIRIGTTGNDTLLEGTTGTYKIPSNTTFIRLSNCPDYTEIDFSGFGKTIKLDSGASRNWCLKDRNLIHIKGLDKIDFSGCTDLLKMFEECNKLTSLDTQSFSGCRPTTMNTMFNKCTTLGSLDLTPFNTDQLTDVYGLVADCRNLSFISGISNFDVSRCSNFAWVFQDCWKLPSINISSWDFSRATTYQGIFYTCKELTSIGNPIWKGTINNCSQMFDGCPKLTNAGDFSNMTLNNANCSNMFYNCSSLTSPITLKGSISNAANMFNGCNLPNGADLSNVTLNGSSNSMFTNALNTSKGDIILPSGTVTDASYMFARKNITLQTTNRNGSDVVNLVPKGTLNVNGSVAYMFEHQDRFDLSDFKIRGKITNMANFIAQCRSITNINADIVDGADLSECRDFSGAFQGHHSNSYKAFIILRNIKPHTIQNITTNTNLTIDLSYLNTWDMSECTNISTCIYKSWNLLDVSSWDLSSCTNMTNWYQGGWQFLKKNGIGKGFFNAKVSIFDFNGLVFQETNSFNNPMSLREFLDIVNSVERFDSPDFEGATIKLTAIAYNLLNNGNYEEVKDELMEKGIDFISA